MSIHSPQIKRIGFLADIILGLISLLKGMMVTLKYLVTPSTVVTQQYPENRKTLKLYDRFRALLEMPHDENGNHKCTGCKICEKACPNASIRIFSQKSAITGKLELKSYVWRFDTCTFCNSCVMVCPFGAICMTGKFENAVYDKRLLVFELNRPSLSKRVSQ